jgi:amino acid adenylation domain-containing protein
MQQLSIAGEFRLSPQQKRLWLSQQDGLPYSTQCAILLQGKVDIEVLQKVLVRVVDRHEILRTTYQTLQEMRIPVQVVLDHSDPVLTIDNLDGCTLDQAPNKVDELLREERLSAIDLSRGPLMKVRLARLGESRSLLLVTLPALSADTVSISRLFTEIGKTYKFCLSGEEIWEEPLHYVQFAEWQNELFESPDCELAMEHWRESKLSPAPDSALPFERRYDYVPEFECETIHLDIETDLMARVESAARQQGVSVEAFMLTCWMILLCRLTGETDIPVAFACDGRVYEEMSDGLGLYARWPIVRAHFKESIVVAHLLNQVSKLIDEAREWQEYFSWRHCVSQSGEGPGESFCSAGFEFHEQPDDEFTPDLSFSLLKVHSWTERFKLKMSCAVAKGALSVDLHYDIAFLPRDTVERLSGQLMAVLVDAANRPTLRIFEIDVLGEAERSGLLVEWNERREEFPSDACVHHLFERQVELTPDAAAVVSGNEQLSYDQLNRRANSLAHYLRRAGVETESIVALRLERSVNLLVAVMGILKAGAAYLPLDPTHPRERISHILRETGWPLVLTQQSLLQGFPERNARVVCLDSDWGAISRERENNPVIDVTPQNAAYVIYTSGSTGKPKGVIIRHLSVVNLAAGLHNAIYCDYLFPLRVSLNAPLAFDSSVKQVIQLLYGHTLCVIPEHLRSDGGELLSLINQQGIDVLDCTPSQLTLLLEAGLGTNTDLGPSLILVGGEAISPAVWQAIADSKGVHYYNVYGPTECTVDATFCRIDQTHDSPTIGRPLKNTGVYVLNRYLRPVSIGVVGELHIAGAGLARGYLKQPELTAEKFIPNPISDEPGARLYKTGDLVRYLRDGSIEFLGRVDNQVKIRGYRIELGEIESVLMKQAGVCQAHVIASEDSTGDKRPVAYLVADRLKLPSTGELRDLLKLELPEYMVPFIYLVLDVLPLNSNGKVDLAALPSPEQFVVDAKESLQPPRTQVEEMVANIWSDVLGLEQVGVEDSFFDLGGHSLLVTQVISRIRRAFRVDIPLRRLFEEPTVAGLATAIDMARKAGEALQSPPLAPVPRDGNLPLSFAQQRLWFLDHYEPGNPFYNVPSAIGLIGNLELEILERVFSEVIRRHEVLRTSYATVDGMPVQVISPVSTFRLPLIDLRELDEGLRKIEASKLAGKEAQRAFDLSKAPLLRARLIQLADEEYWLLLTKHHIVSDYWSLDILIREIKILYQAFSSAKPSPLPELPIQYADFAVWQRQLLQGEVLQRRISYWKRQLSGSSAMLKLPYDHPRPSIQTFRGATEPFAISDDVAAQLSALSRREGVTMFMTMLAAFMSLLQKYTGQDDLVVGSPITNRDQIETEGLIGFFINTLVLRADFGGDPSFREMLRRVREVALDAYANHDLPFEKLVEELQPERDLSINPLFQVVFVLQNRLMESVDMPGLKATPIEVEGKTAKFDMTMFMVNRKEGLSGSLEYNTDLLESDTVRRMLDHFKVLLKEIVVNPDQPLSTMSLLTKEERDRLLVDWNNTDTNYPRESCIHELFEAQASRTPEAIALICRDKSLTYGELNCSADQMASWLRNHGVGTETLVGVCMNRSFEMLVGILGILKAGGAYLPLDPELPAGRISYILEETQAPVVLTQERFINRIQSKAHTIAVDAQWENITEQSITTPTNKMYSEQLAYVMYTSGSTGKPKGVSVQHRSVIRLVKNTNYINLDAEETLLQFAPVSFDASTLEIWGALLNGGRLVLFPGTVASVEEFSDVLESNRVSTLWLTAGLFHQMVENNPRGLATVRQMVAGGDVLSPRHVRKLLKEVKGIKVVNGYGPTENTTFTCCNVITDAEDVGNTVSIGRPIANTQVYVLDNHLQPVPAGVFGELHAGGDGLARGYFNRPDLTAERFIPNPFGASPGGRLYRTGDIVRILPGGSLEFQGRNDSQVKIRGFRIELGEIESLLEQHPAIRNTVVIVREDSPGDKSLAAYAVIEKGVSVNGEDLRAYLRDRLPDYMIPRDLLILNEFPLTPNGKLDKRALPLPQRTIARPVGELPSARTLVEEVLAGIFEQVLGQQQVDARDNFFDLGGHSLLASQVISRVREAFAVQLPLRELFESPTVSELAAIIETARREDTGISTPPLLPVPREGPLPVSFAQRRLWFLNQLDPGMAAYNINSAVRLTGTLHLDALESALSEIVNRHEILRTSFASIDGDPIQVISPGVASILNIVDLEGLSGTERVRESRLIIARQGRQPFDLTSGAPLRATLFRMSETDHIFLLATHHIVLDGWSMGVFIRELAALYESFSTHQESPLPALAIQYADYALWERGWLQGEVLDSHLAYWKQQLGGNLPVLKLPADHPRPLTQTFRGAIQSFELPTGLSRPLRDLSRNEGATLFMILLAAFQTLLYRVTGQDDIVVGTDIAGRNQVETESLIGLFVNHLVLRADLSGDPSFRQLLKRVREMSLGAYAHQALPFDKLVEALNPKRDLSRFPLFQVLFVLQNAAMPSLKFTGLTLTTLKADESTVKFDLALFMSESDKGITAAWSYNAELFDAATITRWASHFTVLLESIARNPDESISRLEVLTVSEREWQGMEKRERNESRLDRLMNIQPKVVDLANVKLVKEDYLDAHRRRPLVLRPELKNVNLASWAEKNKDLIETNLLKHGGILFRGFNVKSLEDFEQVAHSICPELYAEYGDLPRPSNSRKIYDATPYPPDQTILFHNESSHIHRWPLKIFFYCSIAAQKGGETPIIDCRETYRQIPPDIVNRFEEKKLMYVRNFSNGLDVSWQEFFHTMDRSAVESYCRKAGIDFEWRGDDRLRTRQICHAVAKHPKTGERVFFNQIQLFHVSCMDPDVRGSLSRLLPEEEFPRNIYYGDGSRIDDSVTDQIRAIYEKNAVSFAWEAGDILLLDNMLMAHSRNPYVGPRQINVAMGEMIGNEGS